MSVSDELMWRYYELLTDVQLPEIDRMQREVANGVLHPMQAKKDLAGRIVSDFHSAEAAAEAGEDWAKQFQRDEVPNHLETVSVRLADVVPQSSGQAAPAPHGPLAEDGPAWVIRVDKLIVKAGLTGSAAEANRKWKEKAVSLDGQLVTGPSVTVKVPSQVILRVGRQIKRVALQN